MLCAPLGLCLPAGPPPRWGPMATVTRWLCADPDLHHQPEPSTSRFFTGKTQDPRPCPCGVRSSCTPTPSLQTPHGCSARPVLQPQLGHGEHRWVMLGGIPTECTPLIHLLGPRLPSDKVWGYLRRVCCCWADLALCKLLADCAG